VLIKAADVPAKPSSIRSRRDRLIVSPFKPVLRPRVALYRWQTSLSVSVITRTLLDFLDL
jgi:hypothetical protein